MLAAAQGAHLQLGPCQARSELSCSGALPLPATDPSLCSLAPEPCLGPLVSQDHPTPSTHTSSGDGAGLGTCSPEFSKGCSAAGPCLGFPIWQDSAEGDPGCLLLRTLPACNAVASLVCPQLSRLPLPAPHSDAASRKKSFIWNENREASQLPPHPHPLREGAQGWVGRGRGSLGCSELAPWSQNPLALPRPLAGVGKGVSGYRAVPALLQAPPPRPAWPAAWCDLPAEAE